MKLCVCGLAVAGALVWGVGLLIIGLVNRACPEYGWWYLKMMESIYPGYHVAMGLKNLMIGFLWALADGAICGALLAALYNKASGHGCCSKKSEDPNQKCCS